MLVEIVLLSRCYWTPRNKRAKRSSTQLQLCRHVSAIIQLWSVQTGNICLPHCVLVTSRACGSSLYKFPREFARVVEQITLTLTRSLGCVIHAQNRVWKLFWEGSIGAWKTFFAIMSLPILKRVVSYIMIHFSK